jgi:4-amino-4-deoxy-L-arabinose transferase-like glycosyltransferase
MNRKLSLLFISVILFNFWNNIFLPLHPDEAYYWVWAKNLQLSYFDHPPMIAYLIKLVSFIGSAEWIIRLVPIICLSVSCLLIHQLAAEMFSKRVATFSLLLFLFFPMTQVGFSIATPDAPLVLFWTLTLYFTYKAVFDDQPNYFYLAGLTGGLMLLSKYTGIFLFPAIFLFLLTTSHRRLLLRSQVYGAILIALLVFSPVLIWNWQHDWVSFFFQLNHGIEQTRHFDLVAFASYFAGQAGIINPLFFGFLIYYCCSKTKEIFANDKLAFLFWPFVITFGFFAYTALFKKPEPNWPAPAYVSGAIFLAYWLERYRKVWVVAVGVALTTLLVTMVRFPESFSFLPHNAVIKGRYYGFVECFQAAGKYLPASDAVVLSDDYSNAAMIWYYAPGQPEVFILTNDRMSNFDYWEDRLPQRSFTQAIYIGEKDQVAQLPRFFTNIEILDTIHFDNTYVVRDFVVVRCTGFKGLSSPNM